MSRLSRFLVPAVHRARFVKASPKVRQSFAGPPGRISAFPLVTAGGNTLAQTPTSLPPIGSVIPSFLLEWLHALSVTAVMTWSGVAAGLALSVVGAAGVLTHLGLKSRTTFELIPDSAFDPPPGSVLLTAAQLARARRAVSLLPRSASAVRVSLVGDGDGLLRYRMSVPDYARAVLKTALWPGVEPLPPGQSPATSAPPRFHPDTGPAFAELTEAGGSALPGKRTVLRAELSLARTDRLPLKDRGLEPDPLDAFARAFAEVDDGDRVVVHVDLNAVTHARERLWRRLAVSAAEREQRRQDENAESRQKMSTVLGEDPPVYAEAALSPSRSASTPKR